MKNPILKNAITSILAGTITILILSIWFHISISGLIGVLVSLGLIALFVLKVWIKELRLLFSGKSGRYVTITVRKGFHRPFPWFVVKPFIYRKNKRIMFTRVFKFTNESLLEEVTDSFVSKLFGFFVGDVHKNSWRWGLRQDSMDNLYYVVYVYKDGYRANKLEIPVVLYKDTRLDIVVDNNKIEFYHNGKVVWVGSYKFKLINLLWGLGVYIGGGNGKYKADKKIRLYKLV